MPESQAEMQHRNNTFRAKGQKTSWHHHLWKQTELAWIVELAGGQLISFSKCF